MNIIIPIGGVGNRFKDEGFQIPKPLINVLGKSMIYRVIESLNLNDTDKIQIIYHNNLKEYNFESLIKFYFPKINISFISLDNPTRGAAETVLKGLDTFSDNELDENVLLLDCDTFYDDDIISKYKQSINKNLIFYFNDTDPNPIFSYLELNENQVSGIKEKIKISNNANTGAYGFASAKILKEYCSKILDLNEELYISHVYSEMLKDNISIHACEIEKFNCVGTPLQLKSYCNKNKSKASNLRICFDLDNTLVTYPVIPNDYTSVLPIQKNIDYLKLLKKLGNTIIIHTARRMRTSNGNPGKAIADIGKITFDTLHKYDIPYDEIFFGKPYADYYIDDLAINANSSLDKAIGIYDTNIPPRSFNKIEYESNSVIKQTTNLGEVYWYNNMPVKLKKYFPSLIDSYKNKLVLEYVDGISYSYMYSNKTLILADVDILLDTIKDIHSVKIEGSIDISSNYTKKLQNRYLNNLELYSKYENSENIYQKLLTSLTLYEESFKDSVVVIHGDPVFTNVIRTKNGIKLIDMLGKQGDELTLLGDPYYDYAKIYQSIIGYDFILNNFEIDSFYVTTHKKYFESQFTSSELKNIKLITASLLFCLLPLHDEDLVKFTKYFKLINSLI